MLPGTQLHAEDVLHIARRRSWLLVLMLIAGVVVALEISRRLPSLYKSEALMMYEPQRVPDEYVKSMPSAGVDDRLTSLQSQILSRSRLERIITDLGLYTDLRRVVPMDDVIFKMRADTAVTLDTKSSFRVSYISQDAQTAQRVADRLSSLFIEENLRDRENVASDTSGFLDSQLQEAKRQLIEHEKKLEAYRLQFGNQLPSQAPTNLQAMQNAQGQLQALADVADRARERRLLLERQLDEINSEPASDPSAAGVVSTEQQLATAQQQLEVLLTHAKPTHPDVRSLQRTIRDLEAKLSAENAAAPTPAAAPNTSTKPPSGRLRPGDIQRQQRRRDLTDQIADIDRQLAAKQKQENELRSLVASYEAKLDAVPRRESELVELTRDYATLQTAYQNLLSKRQDAKIAANLEHRNIGPTFRVLDPPKVPDRPVSPNRLLINLGGAVGGLLIGVLLVTLLEYRDSSFRSEDEVERLLNLRVLALVPMMVSASEHRSRRRRAVAAGIAAAVVTLGVAVLIGERVPLPF